MGGSARSPGRVTELAFASCFHFAHVLIGKPVATFPGHALATAPGPSRSDCHTATVQGRLVSGVSLNRPLRANGRPDATWLLQARRLSCVACIAESARPLGVFC